MNGMEQERVKILEEMRKEFAGDDCKKPYQSDYLVKMARQAVGGKRVIKFKDGSCMTMNYIPGRYVSLGFQGMKGLTLFSEEGGRHHAPIKD